MKNYPKYAIIKESPSTFRSSVKLLKVLKSGEAIYYRDAGNWTIRVWLNDDGSMTSGSNQETLSLEGLRLIETTEEKWRESNKGYL